MSKLFIAGVNLEIKESRDHPKWFEIHGLSIDEDRSHFLFNMEDLQEIAEWIAAFAGEPRARACSYSETDPRDWEIIVSGPPS